MSDDTIPLPADWKLTPFNELATYETGRTPARAVARFWAAQSAEGIPWISIRDMRPYAQVNQTAERISPTALHEIFHNRISKRGTLIMSFKLTIGRVATLDVDACHNEAIISIFPNSRINQKYLEYFLSQVDYADYQDRAVKGNTLNQQKIDRIEVAEPPKLEQAKIAAVLWTIQKAIQVEGRLVSTARDMKQSSMCQLFTRGLRGEPQKETDIGPIPQSWNVEPLEQLREFLQYGTSTKCEYTQKGNPVIRIPNVMDGKIRADDLKWCELSEREIESLALEPGDVIFIRTNGVRDRVGTCAVYTGQPEHALFASYLIRARLKADKLDPDFLQYFTATAGGLAQLGGQASPAADGKFNVNTKTIDSVLVPLPKPDEQKEIAAILQTIDRKISVHERKRAALSDLFQTMLHQLMSAQIRVDKLDIDTSEVAA